MRTVTSMFLPLTPAPQARLLGGKVRLDLNQCLLFCGDSKAVDFRSKTHSV